MMDSTDSLGKSLRTGLWGAWLTIGGILLSGPLGLLLVSAIQPAGPWQGAQIYAQNYHLIQTLPFYFGFLLVGGYVVMMAALHQMAEERHKIQTLIALILTAIFATLIFFNYINQTTFVPALAQNYQPEYAAAIAIFSLANPLSLCWAIEMWGYAFLGVATWLAAPVFSRNRLETITGWLMIANGVMSLVGALVTAWNLGWVLTPVGLLSYALWNGLVLALSVLVVLSLRRRQRALSSSQPTLSLSPLGAD